MNQQTIQGNWNYLKGAIRKEWSDITGRELDEFEGNLEELIGMIQMKTGQAQQAVEEKIAEFARDASDQAEDEHFAEAMAEKAQAYKEQAATAVQQSADQAAARLRAKYQEAEQVVKSKPMESLALSFAAGLVFGIGATIVLRSK